MVNYQLYRTNVLLGGQMKYDLILNDSPYGLCINDFHITPISNKVPYNKYIKDNLLNYSHNDNISRYYKAISGSFYKDFADAELTNLYPMVSKNKNYDDTYEMGCRRINYELYNKQFSYLCPIWLEQLKENECLMFEFNIYPSNEQTKSFSTKQLYIDILNDDTIYHNKFINYFNNYLKYIKCDEGNDWVIDIKEDCSLINGINMETGSNKISNSRFIYQNLTSRERPLLEQNNMIINEISNNKLIIKQLLNFNFCFNLLDLCDRLSSQIINNKLMGKYVYVGLKVYICDKKNKDIIKQLECVDIFSNHDYIKKICCNPTEIKLKVDNNEIKIDTDSNINDRQSYINPTDNNLNVLSYLQDYNCIDLIDKNKIIQNTIHWSTIDSPEITFNFYRGFSGYLKHDSDNIMLNDTNAYTPNIDAEIYEPHLNQYWCNAIELNPNNINDNSLYINFANDLINTSFKYEYIFSKFNNECTVKNVRYKGVNNINENIYTLILINSIENLILNNKIISDLNIKYYNFHDSDSGVYVIIDKRNPNDIKKFLIFTYNNNDLRHLPLNKIKDELNNILEYINSQSYSDKLIELYSVIKSFVNIIGNPSPINHVLLTIPSSIDAVVAPGPSLSVTELEYIKNNKSKFIERNIGKIKPTFIKMDAENFFNFKFSKLHINDVKSIPKYLNYQEIGYSAKYPSIGYYPFKKDVQSYTPNSSLEDKYEYNCFCHNKLLNLSEDISTTFISKKDENGQYIPLNNIIHEYIKDNYKIDDDNLFQYILSLYNYTYDFEYYNWDINDPKYKYGPDYIYNVKIKLK